MSGWREAQVEAGSEAPAGRGGAACVAIGGNRLLVYGGADRAPQAFGDFWLLELGDSGHALWTKIAPVVKLSHKRKLPPRSGASLTFLPGPGGGDEGRVYLYGGQEPVSGAIFDDMLCLDTASWELSDVQLAPPPPAQQQQHPQQPGQPQSPQQRAARQAPRPAKPPGRHSHVAGAYERGGVVVFGGAGLRGPLSDAWLFDAASSSWRCLLEEQEEDGPPAREMAAGTMISDAGLLIHGGRSAEGALLDDIGIFDCRAGKWVLHQRTGHARCAHSACNAPAAEAAAAVGTAAGEPDAAAAAAAATPAAAGGPSLASNVLLFGGFSGEAVSGDLLQLTFMRPLRGCRELTAQLRPVKAAEEGAPPPRFAHGAAVLSGPGAAQLVVVAGVNQTDDLADVHVWRV